MQLRTELGGRRFLKAFQAVHPNGACHHDKRTGQVSVQWKPCARVVPQPCLPAMPRMPFSGMLLLSASFRSLSLRSSLPLILTWTVRALCIGRSDRTQIPIFVIQGRSLPSLGMPELFATATPKFGRGSLGCSGNSWESLYSGISDECHGDETEMRELLFHWVAPFKIFTSPCADRSTYWRSHDFGQEGFF